MIHIHSMQNELIKKIKKLNEKKYRDEYGLFLIEGEKLADEAYDWDIECFLIMESFYESRDIKKYQAKAPVYLIKDELMKKVSDTVNPQGIIAISKQKKHTAMNSCENPFIIVCEKISDPGNLGAIIRTAYAANATGIILSEGSTDLYGPKTVRAAAGALFHLPIINNVDLKTFITLAKQEGVFFFGTHLKANKSPYELNFDKACAFVIGNESNGLTGETTALMDAIVKIPMRQGAESLNASVACGVLIYEVVRQRIDLFGFTTHFE